MVNKKIITILNLVDDLSPEVKDYLDTKNVQFVSRDKAEKYEEIDYILVETGEEALEASRDYSTTANEIEIICIGQVKDVKKFLMHSGRFVIGNDFTSDDLGKFLADKYFSKNFNIHLDQSFSQYFDKTEDFKITNHLNTGAYVDQMSLYAFTKGFNLVALRSYCDHILYYLTYLKQAGLAGIPYEFEYAASEKFFALNVHCSVRNFVAEYMIDSFGVVNSKDPLQYLLGVVSRSCDYLELTYIEDPGKLCFTAIWTKGKEKTLTGISFNNIKTTAQTLKTVEKKIQDYKPLEVEIAQQESEAENHKTTRLPGSILEMVVSKDEDSVFFKHPEEASNIMAFVVDQYDEIFPNGDMNDIDIEELNKLLGDYPNSDFIQSLKESDLEHLKDKIQKSNITEAYDEEIQRVRSLLSEEDDYSKTLSDSFNEEVAKKVSDFVEADIINQVLGSKEKDEVATRVSGSNDADNPINIVKGGKEDADKFMQTIKGLKEDEKNKIMSVVGGNFMEKTGEFNFKSLAGMPEDQKKKTLANFLSNTLSKEAKQLSDLDPTVKLFLQQNVPERVMTHLDTFIAKSGQTMETLDEETLAKFQQLELPQMMNDVLSNDVYINEFKVGLEQGSFRRESKGESADVFSSMTPEFEKKFRENLESSLANIGGVEKVDEKFMLKSDQLQDEAIKAVVKDAMKKALDEEYVIESIDKDKLQEKEKRIIEDLSNAFSMEKEKAEVIVKGGSEAAKDKELEVVVENIFKNQPGDIKEEWNELKKEDEEEKNLAVNKSSSLSEASLLQKIKLMETENKNLNDKMKAMEIQLISKTETDKVVQKIDDQVQAEMVSETANKNEENGQEVLVENQMAFADINPDLIKKIETGEKLSADQNQKILQALAREQELASKLQTSESHTKKLQIEFDKRESLFKSEINKAHKALKAKEIVVGKAKESMKSLVVKKEDELRGLKRQVEDLNRKLKDDKSTKLGAQVKSLGQQLESANRMSDVYKNKLENMAKSIAQNLKKDNSKALTEENRSLQRLKVQLENKLNMEVKEKKSMHDHMLKARQSEVKHMNIAKDLESKIKVYEGQLQMLRDNQAQLASQAAETKKLDTVSDVASDQFKEQTEHLTIENNELKQKLDEATEQIKNLSKTVATGGTVVQGKEKQLEQSVKKLQNELSKSKSSVAEQKKDFVKLKSENTSLKNQVSALKKELEKLQKTKSGKKAA